VPARVVVPGVAARVVTPVVTSAAWSLPAHAGMSPHPLSRQCARREQVGARVEAASEWIGKLVRLCASLADQTKGPLEAGTYDRSEHAEGARVSWILVRERQRYVGLDSGSGLRDSAGA